VHTNLVRKPEGKRPTEKNRQGTVKTVLTDRVCEGVGWIDTAQDEDFWQAL
jgi:hypothetical protein